MNGASSCAPEDKVQTEVVEAVRQMYAALQADDLAAFKAVVTPDFYAFDAGTRYTAESLVGLIKELHAQGRHYEWNVGEQDVHAACNMAWIAYVNRGSIEAQSIKSPVTWLESAVLEYAQGRWRIHFFHSTRVSKIP